MLWHYGNKNGLIKWIWCFLRLNTKLKFRWEVVVKEWLGER